MRQELSYAAIAIWSTNGAYLCQVHKQMKGLRAELNLCQVLLVRMLCNIALLRVQVLFMFTFSYPFLDPTPVLLASRQILILALFYSSMPRWGR